MHALLLAGDPMVLALDWTTGLLGLVARGLKVAAVLIFLGAIFLAVKNVKAGKTGAALVVVLGTAVAVTFMWQPELIEKIIDAFTGVSAAGITQVTDIVNDPAAGAVGGAVTGGVKP